MRRSVRCSCATVVTRNYQGHMFARTHAPDSTVANVTRIRLFVPALLAHSVSGVLWHEQPCR